MYTGIQINLIFNIDIDIAIFENSILIWILILLEQYIAQQYIDLYPCMYTNNHFSFIKSQCIENENILELVTIVMTAINSVSYNNLITQVKTFLKLEYIPRLLDIHIIILVKKSVDFENLAFDLWCSIQFYDVLALFIF